MDHHPLVALPWLLCLNSLNRECSRRLCGSTALVADGRGCRHRVQRMHISDGLRVVTPHHHLAVQTLLGLGEAQAEVQPEFARVANELAVKGGAWVVIGKMLDQLGAANLYPWAIHWVGVALGQRHQAGKTYCNQ